MDNSYWYYTLSAIPQTLAAALALAATFLIFKMSLLNDKIEARANEVAKLLAIAKSGNADDGVLGEMNDHRGMLREFDRLLPGLRNQSGQVAQSELLTKFVEYYVDFGKDYHQFAVTGPSLLPDGDSRRKVMQHLTRLRDSFATLVEHKHRSFGYLKLNLIFTLVPMSVSLFLLPLHDYIERAPYHGVLIDDLLVAVLVACAIASLSYTAYSVWKIANY